MKTLSIRNQLAGKVQGIVRGPVVSEVIVETAAGTLTSIITTRSVRDMKLKKGDNVTDHFKTSHCGSNQNQPR